MEARETLDAEIAVIDAESARLTAEIERLRAIIAAAEAEIDDELADEDHGVGRAGRVGAGGVARRLRAPPGAEPGRGRGPARRHDRAGVPPVDPVDRSRADPPRRRQRRSRTATTAARSSCRDPGEPAVRGDEHAGRRAAPLLRRWLARESRAVGDRRGRVRRRRPIRRAARDGERVHRRHDQQRGRVPGAHRRARGGRAPPGAA